MKFKHLTVRANNKLTCGRVSRLHGDIMDKFRCWFGGQTTPVSALLPDPGGGGDIPPGHSNKTDRVTCRCPAPHTAVRPKTGVGRRRCSGTVGRAMSVPIGSTHDNAHGHNVISGCYQRSVPRQTAHSTPNGIIKCSIIYFKSSPVLIQT